MKNFSIFKFFFLDFLGKKIKQFCLSDEFKEMFSYEIQLKNGKLEIIPFYENDRTKNWCINVLELKFVKWMKSYSDENPIITSNKLVDAEKFALLYKSLKQKYGDDLVKVSGIFFVF